VPARLPDGRCNPEYGRRKYQVNRKHRREKGKTWYEKNRERVLKQAREYYLVHAKKDERTEPSVEIGASRV
jgi:hypothetical protein